MNRKSLRFISLFLLVSVAITLAGCGKENTEEQVEIKKQVRIQEIAKQSELTSKLTLSATVVPQEYSVIRSLVPGTIEFLAPVGSQVYVGQPLFSIRDESVEANYFNSLQSFQQTQITSNQRVQQAELGLNSVKARLDLARAQYESVVTQTKQNIKTAEDSAVLVYSSAYNSINQILINYNVGALDNYNFSLKNILSSNQVLRSDTTSIFNDSLEYFNDLTSSADRDNLITSLNDIHQNLLLVKNFVDNTSILLQSAIANEGYPVAAIASDKSTNSAYQTAINSHISSVISAISNLENTKINNKISIDQAGSQLDLAEIEYNNADIALQNAKDGASLEQTLSQSQLDQAAYSYNNLRLGSPFSGTILSHYAKAGEQVTIGQELIELGNLSIVEMTVDVDVDFAKAIKLGDNVLIGGQYNGIVTEVEPVGDLKSGKVSVTVQSQEAGQNLVAGSTTDLEFTLVYDNVDTIAVPIKSVTIESSGNYVFVVSSDNVVMRKNVTLGQIYGDKVSVLNGLEEGDRLILLNGVFVAVDDQVEIIE